MYKHIIRDHDGSVGQGCFVFFSNFFCKDSFRENILRRTFLLQQLLGKYFESLPCSNFLKQMVSGSKLKCPISPSIKKCLGEASFSLYYSVICGNCLGNVLVGMKNVEKCAGDSFVYTTDINCKFLGTQA